MLSFKNTIYYSLLMSSFSHSVTSIPWYLKLFVRQKTPPTEEEKKEAKRIIKIIESIGN